MAATIRLTVVTGPHRGRRFCFRGTAPCCAGRAPDCFVQLSGEERDQTISRHHCHLDVVVPFIRVHDLNSSNGTFINGARVTADAQDLPAQTNQDEDISSSVLKNGDVLTIGGSSLMVEVVECPPPWEKGAGDPSIWKPGEVAKRCCAILC
jgi:pSer/pThr/pTyr-binding forkhead associated (FHA) protein